MKAGIIDLKVVKNTAVNDTEVDLDSEKVEDTLTLLNKYIQESDFDLEKERVKTLLKEVYLEACEAELCTFYHFMEEKEKEPMLSQMMMAIRLCIFLNMKMMLQDTQAC